MLKAKHINFSELLGLTFSKIEVNEHKDEIDFSSTDGRTFKMRHYQDCCERVSVEDITGDLSDLIGEPILLAEEDTHSQENPPGVPEKTYQDSFTWTFYKLATRKGYVDIRWYGESNGYYSERVHIHELVSE